MPALVGIKHQTFWGSTFVANSLNTLFLWRPMNSCVKQDCFLSDLWKRQDQTQSIKFWNSNRSISTSKWRIYKKEERKYLLLLLPSPVSAAGSTLVLLPGTERERVKLWILKDCYKCKSTTLCSSDLLLIRATTPPSSPLKPTSSTPFFFKHSASLFLKVQ